MYGRYLDAWPRIGLLAQTAVMSDLQPAPSVFRCLFRITPFTPLLVFLFTCARAGAAAASNELPDGAESRAYQVAALERIARPVLVAASEGRLKEAVPAIPGARNEYAPLEALARTLAGIAPWLELGPGPDTEGRLRARYIDLAVRAVGHAVEPESPGYLKFSGGGQPLVDTAFLAQALLRAPRELWGRLSEETKQQVFAVFRQTREIKPYESNWLLFSAIIEAALIEFGGEADLAPIERAVTRHLEWYKGDGTYGDGPMYHWDYYNSFVIHPMLWEVLEVCARHGLAPGEHYEVERTRARRYAAVLERMISPEGTFPVIGRSAAYRFGALQLLSMMALRRELPDTLTPGGTRAALQAVIRRMLEAPNTFDADGWLQVGVVGHQSAAAEVYINTGSLYLCTLGLLHLGLPPDDPFWTAPNEPWTQQRIWSGENVPADHALKE